jgi:hypothetical protein
MISEIMYLLKTPFFDCFKKHNTIFSEKKLISSIKRCFDDANERHAEVP